MDEKKENESNLSSMTVEQFFSLDKDEELIKDGFERMINKTIIKEYAKDKYLILMLD